MTRNVCIFIGKGIPYWRSHLSRATAGAGIPSRAVPQRYQSPPPRANRSLVDSEMPGICEGNPGGLGDVGGPVGLEGSNYCIAGSHLLYGWDVMPIGWELGLGDTYVKLTLLVPVTRPGMCHNLDAKHLDARHCCGRVAGRS